MASASDVPNRYDVVINGEGYICADLQDLKAEFGYTPTFIGRQNVQGDYGDNQQDFFQAETQKDWSLGEQQRYWRSSNDDSKRRFWQGSNVDIRIDGQVSMRVAASTATAAASVVAVGQGMGFGSSQPRVPFATSTNAYSIAADGTITNHAAHGLGASPSPWGLSNDGTNIFLTTTAAGTVGVRKMSTGSGTFSTFSASGADSLAYLNNALYGLRNASGDLVRWDTAGTLTSLFTWKDASGTAIPLGTGSKVIPFGGKLAILRIPTPGTTGSAEIYIYDGNAPSLVYRLPMGFQAYDICEVAGSLFISGVMPLASGSGAAVSPVIHYYANGTVGRLWRSYSSSTVAPAMVAWGDGLAFVDASRSALMFYDPARGGVQTMSTSWASSGSQWLAATQGVLATDPSFVFGANGTTTTYLFLDSGAAASSSTITTSLFDFDNSLTKIFRGVRVEFDSASDGNGGTVDISYRTGDVSGSYTSLQTGATSGTEYTLSGVTGRSISIKVTLNKGTSTNGPVLKRISVRAAPQQTNFPKRTYVLLLAGRNEVDPEEGQMMHRRDGTRHHKDGVQMRDDLVTAATATSPISITDEISTYTGIIDLDNFKLQRMRRGEYLAIVPVRGV